MARTIDLEERKQFRVLLNPVRQDIIHLLRRAGRPMTANTVAEKMLLSPSAAQSHLNKLEELGVVELGVYTAPDGRQATYYRLADVEIRLCLGLPLILISTPSIHQHFEPENIAISFVENLSNANFQEAKKLSTPESAETLYLFETLVGNQSDELKNTPTHFNISYSEMNTSQDTLFVQGKLFFSHKHKLIRKINLTLVNRRGSWLVDCRDNTIF